MLSRTQSLLSILFLCVFFSCSNKREKLTIAVAANARQVIEKLSAEFEKEQGVTIDIVSASSGKLSAQIMAGAPYDVFISADLNYPFNLYENGFSTKAPETYALGRLVLICNDEIDDLDMTYLRNESIQHIAISNPKTAPYGFAAIEAIRHYGLEKDLNEKLVFGESVGQCNQFFISGAADLALTSQSILYSFEFDRSISHFYLDSVAYSPIKQGVIEVENGNNKHVLAHKYYLFLFSKKAQNILESYGYKTPI